MLSLRCELMKGLPPLAWLGFIDLPNAQVSAWHGTHVIAGDNWLFDGAWAGPCHEGQFVGKQVVAGTGLKLDRGAVLLVPPSYTSEGLFYKPLPDGCTLVSNSLPLILSALQDRFPPVGRHAWGLLSDIRFGVDFYKRKVPTSKGEIRRTYWHVIKVDVDGYHEHPIPDPPAFKSFAEYRDFLSSQLQQLFANAADRQRARPFTPLLALSSGYDSTAIAALTRPLELHDAVGFSHARAYFGESDDSGAKIAQLLGLSYEVFDKNAYLQRDDAIEALFLANGLSGEDVIFAALEKRLPDTLFLTGVQGDRAWSKIPALLSHIPGFSGISGVGASITEYRLQMGFIHMPVPYIGCQDLSPLEAISCSDEMRPYSVGGDYDRPIPRRIAEEAGIPRDAFGRKKKATSQQLARHDTPMSDASEADFAAYVRAHQHEILPPSRFREIFWNCADKLLKRLEWRIHNLSISWKIRIIKARAAYFRAKPQRGEKGLLHRWAIDKRITFYRDILIKSGWLKP